MVYIISYTGLYIYFPMFSFLVFLNPLITHSGPTQVLSTPWFTWFMLPRNCPPFCLSPIFFPVSARSHMCSRPHVITSWTVQWRPRSSVKGLGKKPDEMKRDPRDDPCSLPTYADSKSWKLRPSLLHLPPGPCLGINAVTVASVYFYTLSNSHVPCCPAVERGLFCLSLRVSPSPAAPGSQLESFG